MVFDPKKQNALLVAIGFHAGGISPINAKLIADEMLKDLIAEAKNEQANVQEFLSRYAEQRLLLESQ